MIDSRLHKRKFFVIVSLFSEIIYNFALGKDQYHRTINQ